LKPLFSISVAFFTRFDIDFICCIYTGAPSALYDRTNIDWAPTKNMGHDRLPEQKVALAKERSERATSRVMKRKLEQLPTKRRKRMLPSLPIVERHNTASDLNEHIQQSPTNSTVKPSNHTETTTNSETLTQTDGKQHGKSNKEPIQQVSTSCQTDLTVEQINQYEVYVQNLTSELVNLKKDICNMSLAEDGFKDNEVKTKFYTGLQNYLLLMCVFNLLIPKLKTTSANALSQFQEYVMVLMRLKLNLPLQDLGYRFKISTSTVSRIFYRWIDVMNERLNFLIKWPEREELRKTMPMVFQKNFGKSVAIIIDCFEVFIDRPSSLIARAMTWSNYKHHNTVKFLIGITPQGVIAFISQAWGGRVSDKYITENCGILRNLLPGDIMLADRGFDISDSVGYYQARLYIPAFTKGKKQLSALEVEHTRKIANVRIHVERVIGLVRRKYSILQSILPIESVMAKEGQRLAPIDKIARVCCALTNLSDSIVPFD